MFFLVFGLYSFVHFMWIIYVVSKVKTQQIPQNYKQNCIFLNIKADKKISVILQKILPSTEHILCVQRSPDNIPLLYSSDTRGQGRVV